MSETLLVTILTLTLGTFVAVLKLIFQSGRLVARIDNLDAQVQSIDLHGCRHKQSPDYVEGD